MKSRITITIASLVLALLFVGEAFAQPVPSSVTQQLRLSTGGTSPFYVQHRAAPTVTGAPPAGYNAVGGYYAWDQVPATGSNYLLFLNTTNEVRRTSSFGVGEAYYIATVDALGNTVNFTDPSTMIVANNGLTKTWLAGVTTIQMGGDLIQATTIDQDGNNMTFTNTNAAPSSFNVTAGAANTLNVNIDPGATGNVNLANIPTDNTTVEYLTVDATGNVRSHDLTSLVMANNGLSVDYATTPGTAIVQLGGPTGTPSALINDRYVAMATNDINFEGTGNFNLGNGGVGNDFTVNINTGPAGNLTLQGTTLTPAIPAPANFLYVDATNNVRSATADDLPAGTATTWIGVDGVTGNIVTGDPMGGIYRGKIAGDGGYTYTSPVLAGLNAGASIICTVDNRTGVLGSIIVQVTDVDDTADTFDIECSENVQLGSSISFIVMNP